MNRFFTRLMLSLAAVSCCGLASCGTSPTGGDIENASVDAVPGPQGPQGDPGQPGSDGTDGTNGADGADGQLRIYGDGSAGALTVANGAHDEIYVNVATNFNLQFTDVTIDAGGKLVVPSGTVIRCTGSFTNNGTIIVNSSYYSGGQGYFMSGPNGSYASASVGPKGHHAEGGEIGNNSEARSGGRGGDGLSLYEAIGILNPGPLGGGGGAGGIAGVGGDGGGTLVVLAATSIVNGAGAAISADGDDGGVGAGGGGGGIIILASPGSVSNLGALSVRGGPGGNSGTSGGSGGGGGGGIVHLLAPSITAGTIVVTGAASGTNGNAGSVSAGIRAGGGGGGSCGAGGGAGGDVSQTGTPTSANNAAGDGYAIQSQVDPTALF